MSELTVTISHVGEHDVHLLLAEEFVASSAFRPWFLESIGLPGSLDVVAVDHSAMDTDTGESDLEVTLRTDTGDTKLLIEVKIDAVLQPNQAERYRARASNYCAGGSCVFVQTVIVAPAEYFRNETDHYGFDHRVEIESVLDWFEKAEALGNRRCFKTALLRQALRRLGNERWGRAGQCIEEARAGGPINFSMVRRCMEEAGTHVRRPTDEAVRGFARRHIDWMWRNGGVRVPMEDSG